MLEITSKNKQDAALSYLKSLVIQSPFNNHVFLVGGACRDIIQNKIPKDLDVVVDGSGIDAGIKFSEWACRKMGNFKDSSNPVIFPKFGTSKFILKGIVHDGIDLSDVDIECVAPRIEEYDGKTRKPIVKAGTLIDDIMRRDFSVNSLLLNLTTDKIIDYTGHGIQDIKNGIIRTTDDNSDKIFAEDSLRILRAIRFSVRENWKIATETLEAMKRNVSKLQNISSERITSELDKILMTDRPDDGLRLLQQIGALKYIMPEAEAMVGVTQNKFHDQDVWSHTLSVIKNTPPNLITRISVLMHDIGKPVKKTVIDNEVHFYAHEWCGSEMARTIMTRLKYPREIIEPVVLAVKNHMRLKQSGDQGQHISDKALRKLSVDLGPHLHDVLSLMQSDNLAHSELGKQPNQIPGIIKRLGQLKDTIPQKGAKLPITGADLQQMGLKPGPLYKELLDLVKDKQLEEPNTTKEQYLELIKNHLQNNSK
jgi:tRNA nucleotidyltransferase/poly(A) polymerase